MTKNHFVFLEQPLVFDLPDFICNQLLGGKAPMLKFLKHLPDEKVIFQPHSQASPLSERKRGGLGMRLVIFDIPA